MSPTGMMRPPQHYKLEQVEWRGIALISLGRQLDPGGTGTANRLFLKGCH